jgi:spermidine synthase
MNETLEAPAEELAPSFESQEDATDPARLRGLLALACLAFVTVATQLLVVRILSFTVNQAFGYLAIALAMCGFGAASTWGALGAGLLRRHGARITVAALLAFGPASALSAAAYARLSTRVLPENGLTLLGLSALILGLFALPFFVAGLGTAAALGAAGGKIGRVYAADLLGAALGAAVLHPLLAPLGAPRLLLALGLVAAMTGGAVATSSRRLRRAAFVSALALVLGLVFADELLPFRRDAGDHLATMERGLAERGGKEDSITRVFGRWDPHGRIELHRFPGDFGRFAGEAPTLLYTQDAGAGSFLASLRDHPEARRALVEGSAYGLATGLRPASETLVLGVGGGPDISAALGRGAKRITAVEINEVAIRVLDERRVDFLGWPADERRLRFVHGEGRSFVRAHREAFDVIQMTGADTYAASATGAATSSESYLYTVEAFEDYLAALRPGGLLQVTRFGLEASRILTTVMEALARRGVVDPRHHLAVLAQGPDDQWRTVIIARDGFSTEDVRRLRELVDAGAELGPRCTYPAYDLFGFGFATPMRLRFAPGASEDLAGALRAQAAASGLDFSPTYDDRPFFFHFFRGEGLSWRDLKGRQEALNPFHAALRDRILILVQMGGLASILALVPLFFLRGAGGGVRARWATLMVATGLGAGYMLFEIALMQKTALFLGHPIRSIAAVLVALLVGTGLGSLLSGLARSRASRELLVHLGMVGLLGWTAAFLFGADRFFADRLTAPVSERIAWTAALVTPLGVLLGVFFPLLVGRLNAMAPALVPWSFGANAVASVVASLAAIPLAMEFGFAKVLAMAAGCYLLAALGFRFLRD